MGAIGVAVLLSVVLCAPPGDTSPGRFPHLSKARPSSHQREDPLENHLPLLSFKNARPPANALATTGEKCRVAILKFFNAQQKKNHDWIAYELADSLVRKLKAFFDVDYLDPFTVPSFKNRFSGKKPGRVSKARIASLARRAKADVVVVGSYSFAGDTICADVQAMRPSVDLISAPLHFESPADRIWFLEEEMAASAAELLGLRLSDKERVKLAECPTSSDAAFEEYCKGKQAPEGSYSKIQHFQKAIEADPACVEAHYLLGNAYYGIGMAYRYMEWFTMALDEYRKAAALAPDCAKIHCALGVTYMVSGRYDLARKSLEKALETDPGMKLARGYLLRLERMGF